MAVTNCICLRMFPVSGMSLASSLHLDRSSYRSAPTRRRSTGCCRSARSNSPAVGKLVVKLPFACPTASARTGTPVTLVRGVTSPLHPTRAAAINNAATTAGITNPLVRPCRFRFIGFTLPIRIPNVGRATRQYHPTEGLPLLVTYRSYDARSSVRPGLKPVHNPPAKP
jgi:hypothetical protein